MSEMVTVFVSYASKDRAFAQRLVNDLKAAGAEVWWDVSANHEVDFIRKVNIALQNCQWLVFVLTPNAFQSNHVAMEVDAGIHRHQQGFIREIIPVLASACEPGSIPPHLHRYDAVADYDGEINRLKRTLGLSTKTDELQKVLEAMKPTRIEKFLGVPMPDAEPDAIGQSDLLEVAQKRWKDVRKAAQQRSPSVSGLLLSARAIALEQGAQPTLVIEADYQFHFEQLSEPVQRQTVEWALEQVLEASVLVRFTLTPNSVPTIADAARPAQHTGPRPSR